MIKKLFFSAIFCVFAFQSTVHAAVDSSGSAHHGGAGIVMAMLALVLVVGKIGAAVERRGQPAVVGELLAGIVLAAAAYFGVGFIDQVRANDIIAFIAQLGAVILLFSIGLESSIADLKKVGLNALLVALIGVIAPFLIGSFVLAPWLFPDASTPAKIFLGASLVATSVGITVSVFRSLGIQKTRAAQTVLGAAVIDDVLGLIVLAVVASLAAGSEPTPVLVFTLAAKSFGFLAGALVLGKIFAKPLSTLLCRIHKGIGMKVTLALGPALLFAYMAELFGLEPIIGAFAAGLLLEHVHFRSFDQPQIVHDLKTVELDTKDKERVNYLIRKHSDAHVEDFIASIGMVFIPVFFVYTGLSIDFGSLLNPRLYIVATLISIVAILTKMAAGVAAKGSRKEKLLVGASMVPRGEVGLIFAAVGQQIGAINQEMFSTIILVVIMTTFVGPFLIKKFAE
jgi:Kef-type K+ transport system membrane component KefB